MTSPFITLSIHDDVEDSSTEYRVNVNSIVYYHDAGGLTRVHFIDGYGKVFVETVERIDVLIAEALK